MQPRPTLEKVWFWDKDADFTKCIEISTDQAIVFQMHLMFSFNVSINIESFVG